MVSERRVGFRVGFAIPEASEGFRVEVVKTERFTPIHSNSLVNG